MQSLLGVSISTLKEKLHSIFANQKYEALVIINSSEQDSNFKYLTGFTSGIFEQTVLIAGPDGAKIIVNKLEEEVARKQADGAIEVVCANRDLLHNELRRLHGKKLGINASFIPVSYAKMLSKVTGAKSLVDASQDLLKVRSIKDEYEIKQIRKAVRITKAAIEETVAELEPGQSEEEVAARFEYNQAKLGARISFPSIVAFGPNASMPHYMPGKRRLASNEAVLFDVGGVQNNYCSDISRTVIFKPDRHSIKYKRVSEMVEVVKEAQQLALKEMYEGNDASSPHNAAASYIDSYKDGIYKGRFIHALGHSIGIEVHDGQTIPSKMRLERNMVFSDEPGIYIPKFGGVRFEDDVLIGKKSRFL